LYVVALCVVYSATLLNVVDSSVASVHSTGNDI